MSGKKARGAIMRLILVASLSVFCGFVAQAGDSVPPRDLAVMQGRWRLSTKHSVLFSVPKAVTEKFPGDLGKALADIRIDGNHVYVGSAKEPISMAIDLKVDGLRASAEGFRLLCLTFSDGRAI